MTSTLVINAKIVYLPCLRVWCGPVITGVCHYIESLSINGLNLK